MSQTKSPKRSYSKAIRSKPDTFRLADPISSDRCRWARKNGRTLFFSDSSDLESRRALNSSNSAVAAACEKLNTSRVFIRPPPGPRGAEVLVGKVLIGDGHHENGTIGPNRVQDPEPPQRLQYEHLARFTVQRSFQHIGILGARGKWVDGESLDVAQYLIALRLSQGIEPHRYAGFDLDRVGLHEKHLVFETGLRDRRLTSIVPLATCGVEFFSQFRKPGGKAHQDRSYSLGKSVANSDWHRPLNAAIIPESGERATAAMTRRFPRREVAIRVDHSIHEVP